MRDVGLPLAKDVGLPLTAGEAPAPRCARDEGRGEPSSPASWATGEFQNARAGEEAPLHAGAGAPPRAGEFALLRAGEGAPLHAGAGAPPDAAAAV